jgi:hypothetical protein
VQFSPKFLLLSVFFVLPAVCCGQDNFDLLLAQINKVQRQSQDKQFELEMKLQDQAKDIQDLAKRQDALRTSLGNANFDIEFLKSMRGADDVSKKLDAVESKLYETGERLRKAEATIEILDLRLSALEPRARRAPARNRAPDSFPDTPATAPHPATKKSDASKPKTTANKPTREYDAQGNPIPVAMKPQNPSSKPVLPQ